MLLYPLSIFFPTRLPFSFETFDTKIENSIYSTVNPSFASRSCLRAAILAGK